MGTRRRLPLKRCFFLGGKSDVKKLGPSRKGLRYRQSWLLCQVLVLKAWGGWLMGQEQPGVFTIPLQRGQEPWGTEVDLHLGALEKARRDRTCACPQLITTGDRCEPVLDLSLSFQKAGVIWSGCRKGFIKFYDLIISSWICNKTPGKPELGPQLVHWERWNAAPSQPLLATWAARIIH